MLRMRHLLIINQNIKNENTVFKPKTDKSTDTFKGGEYVDYEEVK